MVEVITSAGLLPTQPLGDESYPGFSHGFDVGPDVVGDASRWREVGFIDGPRPELGERGAFQFRNRCFGVTTLALGVTRRPRIF